jgi:hypothetical protein
MSRSAAREIAFLFLGTALASPIWAHDHEPDWAAEGALQQGLFLDLRHPLVIRQPNDFEIVLRINNLAAAGTVVVERLQYQSLSRDWAERRTPGVSLPSKRALFDDYQMIHAAMKAAEQPPVNVDLVHRLAQRKADRMVQICQGVFVDRLPIARSDVDWGATDLRFLVTIDLLQDGIRRTEEREVTIPIEEALPNGMAEAPVMIFDASTHTIRPTAELGRRDRVGPPGGPWFAGDQHLHTVGSIDARVLEGTNESVTEYAQSAELQGLGWIIVTDHSNVHIDLPGLPPYYTPSQHQTGTDEAAQVRAQTGFLALYSQEMGLGQQGGLSLPSHYLTYPAQSDSMGYLCNPSSGLQFGSTNCEPEQVIIDRVTAAGGIGFIAHPFASTSGLYETWDFNNGATGWAGIEIWSDHGGKLKNTDKQSVIKWLELLTGIGQPAGGQLPIRAGFPTKFPVGIGNSDAHVPQRVGRTFTYSRIDSVDRPAVMDSFVNGRCIASNGPLAFGTLAGAGTGEVAQVVAGPNTLDVFLQTTPEFGPVGDYKIFIAVDGIFRTVIPPSGSPAFAMQFSVQNLNLAQPDRFIVIYAKSKVGREKSIANPIWLEFI